MSRILVDCDDVIINLTEQWINRLNEIYGTSYTTDDIPDWNLTGMFEVPKKDLLKPLREKEVWVNCKDIPGAVHYLEKLHNDGHEILVVTATDYRNIAWKIEYLLSRYFPFINEKNIIMCHNKTIIDADYLIDDNIENLTAGNYQSILFTRPHNRGISDIELDKYKIIRARDWNHCYELIKKRTVY